MTKEKFKQYFPLILMAICIIISAVFLIFNHDISIKDIISYTPKNKWVAFAIFMGIYAIKAFAAILPFDGIVLASGIIFDMPQALFVNILGTIIFISITYWIGYRANDDWISHFLSKSKKLQKYYHGQKGNYFILCFALRKFGITGNILGVLFGSVHMNFWKFILSYLLGALPTMLCFTVFGNNISFKSPLFICLIIFDIIVLIFTILYYRRLLKKEKGENDAK